MQLSEQKIESRNVILPYLFSQPPEDQPAPEGGWPLIFFLHGSGERGRDLARIRSYGIPRAARRSKDFPFFTVSPLCPQHTYWEDLDSVLFDLLDAILTGYPANPRRVYLTGLSMGGHGAWILALQQPQRFAALAPVCPPFPNLPDLSERLPLLVNKPIWVFHGAKDAIVPIEHSQTMVDMLRKLGGAPRFTVYPNARHDSWRPAYANPALYEWFLEQSL